MLARAHGQYSTSTASRRVMRLVVAGLLATAIAAALLARAKHNPPEPRWPEAGSHYTPDVLWREPYDLDEPVALFV